MTRPGVINRPGPDWPPACVAPQPCGFVGIPGAESSPYLACGGDPVRHYRRPVDPRFRRSPQPGDEPVDRPAAVTPPRRQQAPRRPTRGQGTPPWTPTPPTEPIPVQRSRPAVATRKPFRWALVVACSHCGAREDQACRTAGGFPTPDIHAARTDAAHQARTAGPGVRP